jgi:hypothetical protein
MLKISKKKDSTKFFVKDSEEYFEIFWKYLIFWNEIFKSN